MLSLRMAASQEILQGLSHMHKASGLLSTIIEDYSNGYLSPKRYSKIWGRSSTRRGTNPEAKAGNSRTQSYLVFERGMSWNFGGRSRRAATKDSSISVYLAKIIVIVSNALFTASTT
jgi:hypothetical protein